MKHLITLGLPILWCIVAAGAEKPAWTSHTPSDTAKTLFFVGRSPKVESEAEGLRMASKDAREQLLRQEFGTTVKVDTTQSETLKDVSLSSQLSEISDLVLLKGFKQTDVYTEKIKDYVEVWALYRVPVSEIKEEKRRVTDLQRQKAKFSAADANKVYVAQETPATDFNNGGKPKLRKGMKKSQIIRLFGKPRQAEQNSYFGGRFTYHKDDGEFCNSSLCFVNFTTNGIVESWTYFKPEYTTDLDDKPIIMKKEKALQDRADSSKEHQIIKPSLTPNRSDLQKIKISFLRKEKNKYFFRIVNKAKYILDKVNYIVVGRATGHSSNLAFDVTSEDGNSKNRLDCEDDKIIPPTKESVIVCNLKLFDDSYEKKLNLATIEVWLQSADFEKEGRTVTVKVND